MYIYWYLSPITLLTIKIAFYSTPFWGRVYNKWKFCLFVCLSSLLILFLQTLSSRNIPQSTLITQPLPRLTSGVELCVNLTFFCICPDFLKKSTKILKKFHSLIPSVQCSLPCVGNNSQSRCSTLPCAENFPTHNLKHRLCTQKKINQQICVKFCTQWFFLVFVYLVFVHLEIVMSEISVTVYQVHNRP